MPYYNSFITKVGQLSIKELTLLLVGMSWLSGLGLTIAGFGHWFYPLVAVFLIFPALVLMGILTKSIQLFKFSSTKIKGLTLILVTIWLSHFIQVWVPETGFDALWYHLPVTQLIVEHHGFYYDPQLYQSVNPLWSDLFFVAGFQLGGMTGAKLVAYGFGLSLLLVTWQLCRMVLNRKWSLAVILIISTFQVISWQSASFYIDLANAFWLLSAVWLLLLHLEKDRKCHQLVRSAALLGASLATKLFSVLLLPVMGVILWFHSKPAVRWKNVLTYEAVSVMVALPYYLFAYFKTGNPVYAIQLHLEKLAQIGGQANSVNYIFQRTLQLPWSLIQVSLVRDYVWIVLPLLWIAIGLNFKQIRRNTALFSLLIFAIGEWLVWWYVPPLSTRYAVAGFITLVIVGMWSVNRFLKNQSNNIQTSWWLVVGASVVIQFAPRLYVNYRSLKYLLGFQTQTQYLHQFYDGWTDPYLDQWYK